MQHRDQFAAFKISRGSTHPRYIPHQHKCYICGSILGCSDDKCEWGQDVVCDNLDCVSIAENAVVHQQPANKGPEAVLPCCGVQQKNTPMGDLMSRRQDEVTCQGRSMATHADQ